MFLRLFLSLHVLPLRSACSIKAQGVTIGPNQTEHAYGSRERSREARDGQLSGQHGPWRGTRVKQTPALL